jgi:hypothetical protein
MPRLKFYRFCRVEFVPRTYHETHTAERKSKNAASFLEAAFYRLANANGSSLERQVVVVV